MPSIELPSTLSGSEWFRPQSGDSGGAEELFELTAGCTAQWPSVIRQPKAGQENCWSPGSHGQVWAGELLFSLVHLGHHGWLDPSSIPDLDLNVHASCFPSEGNTDMHSRWEEVQVGTQLILNGNNRIISVCLVVMDLLKQQDERSK